MERTGGEPDVVGHDTKTGEYIFYDCSAESPIGRRNVCYDREGQEAREKPDKEKLLEILARLDNNITHVAKEIRCSKVSVYRYLDEYEIDIPGRPRKKNKKK